MKKEYLIKVRSVNIVEGDESREEMITHASLSGTPEDYTIAYSEDSASGSAETTVRVIGGECVSIRRKAEIETYMVIEQGKRHTSEHRLPFGSFNLEVIGTQVSSSMKENGAELTFSYTTYQDNKPLGKAVFNMLVRKKGKIPKDF